MNDNNYVTGDKLLNHIILIDNPKIRYIKTDFIKKRKKFYVKIENWRGFNERVDLREIEILVTGHSDNQIDENELDILNLSNLKLWICQNKNVSHPKLISIPIGITNYDEPNSKIHKIIGNTDKLYNIAQQSKNIENLVYLNITVKNFPKERKKIVSLYSDKKWVTFDKPDQTNMGHTNFINKIRNHKFIFAPRGNGIDTHRIWEAIYLKTIPIVKKCIGMENFYHLPILFVDTWDDITEEYLNLKYEEINNKKHDLSMVNINYWYKLLIEISNISN